MTTAASSLLDARQWPDSAEAQRTDTTAPAFSDGFVRNIYACVMRNRDAVTITVPAGKYLADVAPDLPRHTLLYANTGIGKTTYALDRFAGDADAQVLFVTSTQLHVQQIEAARHAAGRPCDVYYEASKTANADSALIVTCYESFGRVRSMMNASRVHLIIDEVHNVAASGASNYRGHALDAVLDAINGDWRTVTLLTGTPVPLSHPALTGFVEVHVKSHVRVQPARRVVWKCTDDDGNQRSTGRKIDKLLALVKPGARYLIYLNDKGKKLNRLRAGLVANGFNLDDIAVLHADEKNGTAGRAIVEHERIPDDVQVLIVTSVALEAINIRTTFDAVHIYSDLHPLLAQQLVNRLRTSAAGIVYWYNAGDGFGRSIDVRDYQRHWLDMARQDADKLNACEAVNLDDNSPAAIIARQTRRLYARGDAALVRPVTMPDGRRQWDVSYTAVDNAVFQSVSEYTRRNPSAFKRMLDAYGWHWRDDVQLGMTMPAPARRAAEADTAGMLEAERLARHQKAVEQVRRRGLAGTQVMSEAVNLDAVQLRAAGDVLRVYDAMTKNVPADANMRDAFTEACDIVLEAADSRRAVNDAVRRIRIQRLRNRCPFTGALYAAFTIGDVLTPDVIHQRVRAVYEANSVMQLYAEARYRYPFSTNKESRLTQKKAVEVLRDLFTVKRRQVQRDGVRAWHYELLDDNPMRQKCTTIADIDIPSQAIVVHSDDEARSLFCADEVQPSSVSTVPDEPTNARDAVQSAEADDLLHWFLATEGKHHGR